VYLFNMCKMALTAAVCNCIAGMYVYYCCCFYLQSQHTLAHEALLNHPRSYGQSQQWVHLWFLAYRLAQYREFKKCAWNVNTSLKRKLCAFCETHSRPIRLRWSIKVLMIVWENVQQQLASGALYTSIFLNFICYFVVKESAVRWKRVN